ncbi:dihydrolipoyl dehydrogenase [Photobacterium sp. SDRW27]|uniref:dihydrolipoyl dehydrogenase n=1 Tax=Photobacterium obscurum TaxID=2829490 RepID=UPI0022445F05|nr:dihydrolipoyl dehydrogenase [Photobacterium obscurum]MCW8329042.1 dihydrolipoyl dehydrogenase [Photobacterium obscurum]
MTEAINVDVAVLGGGPGGYTAAFRAADLGLSVCIIEQQKNLGGVCVNVGCIPSKTLLHAAAILEEAKDTELMGISFGETNVDLGKLRDHKEKTITNLTSGLDALCKARKIIKVQARGYFQDKNTLKIEGTGGQLVNFKHAIIATGSHPYSLPIAPDDTRIWDSTEALNLSSIPEKLLIVGGGIIGLEMAQVYSALGSEITIVEALEQVIPQADKDVVQPLLKKLKKEYRIFTKTKVTEMQAQKAGIQVTMDGTKAPESEIYDAVLVAVGRKPNSHEIGLEELGLQVDEKGLIPVNEHMQTIFPHIYAIGDIVSGPMLAHKATHEGKVAAEVIAGHKVSFLPMTIPSVAYTNPEIAWMGLTEKEAKAKNIEYHVGKVPWIVSGRAQSVGAANGVTKALFDKKSGRLIGAGICGVNAGELIHEAVMALQMGATVKDIVNTVHAHPTLAETMAFAAELVDGTITDMLPQRKR